MEPKRALDDLRIDRNTPRKPASGIWLAVISLSIVLLALIGWAFSRPRTIEVRTAVVREFSGGGSRTLLNGSGYVTARREATVSSKVTGKVVEVLIEEGVQVKAGQLLARLDGSNVLAALKLAENQLAAAKSLLKETDVRLKEAEVELGRITRLAQAKVADPASLDRAAAEVDSLKARLERQQVEISVSESELGIWHQQLEDTIIRAPFDGVVTSKNAQPGEMISPMSAGGGFTRTGICTIVDMDSLEIEVDVNESFINRVEAGQSVQATLDAYPDWKIPCKVIAIVPTADRQKSTVKVRVGFDKLDPRILPQMSAKVAFQSGASPRDSAPELILPKAAIRHLDGRDVVIVVQNGRAERRMVTLGPARNDELIIRSGVASGEHVVVEGPVDLKAGDRIQEIKR